MGLISLLIAFSLSAQAEELAFRTPRNPKQPYRMAIVFGLNGKIGSTEDIVSAERSAVALAETLHGNGFDVYKVLTGPDATLAKLNKALMDAAKMNLGDDDTLLIAAITHGGRCVDPDEEESKEPVQQLRIVETRASDNCWQNATSDKKLLESLRASGAGRRMLYIDACNTRLDSMGIGGATGPMVRPEEEVVLRSAGTGGTAYADKEYTLFTRAFIDSLNDPDTDTDGDGAITAQEVASATYELVYKWSERHQTTSQTGHASGPTNTIVLKGTPSATKRPVLANVPVGLWSLGETEQDFNVPNDLVVTGEGVLTGRDKWGTSIRVGGVPEQPGRHDASTWVAGRRRGPPSLVVAGGVQGMHISEDSILEQVLSDQSPTDPAVWVGIHQVVLKWLSLNSNIYVQNNLPALTFSAVPELNRQGWTGGLGVTGGWMRIGLKAAEEGQTLHIGGLACGHAEVRRGIRPELALVLAADAGVVLGGCTKCDLKTPGIELFPAPWTSLRVGVLWDPGVTHHNRSNR